MICSACNEEGHTIANCQKGHEGTCCLDYSPSGRVLICSKNPAHRFELGAQKEHQLQAFKDAGYLIGNALRDASR